MRWGSWVHEHEFGNDEFEDVEFEDDEFEHMFRHK
jgi:hypothetical protein